MIFKDTEEQYLEEALHLAMEELESERQVVEALPVDQVEGKLRDSIEWLFSQKYGKVAMKDGIMVGYLAFAGPWDGFFGNVKGVFSPFGGSAVSCTLNGNDREKIASMLVEQVTSDLVKDNVTSIAICRCAHDVEVAHALVFNGFGIRCSDLILDLVKDQDEQNLNLDLNPLRICELEKARQHIILPLKKALDLHMTKAPIFMPNSETECENWFLGENRIFAALEGDIPVGFMSIEEEAETIITECKCMANINGAYVLPQYRGKNVAEMLLTYVKNKCKEEGRTLLGVDCETLNPTAIHFWPKHFTPYTYSYTRRIDERICK